jgi:zinc protease
MTKLKFLTLILALLLVSYTTSYAVNLPVTEKILDNGLKVLIIEDHKSPLAVFQIWYRVGSRNDPRGKTGLSHFLEHMMFKGTEKYGQKVFSQIIQRAGGVDNAYTTMDYTAYFQKLSSDRLDLSITLESDRMRGLLLQPEEVIAERNVVKEERRMRMDDTPQSLVYEEVIATAFNNSPYRWPAIGWMEDIQNFSRQDLVTYYNTYYVPNNAFIVIAGDVDVAETIRKIENSFGMIPRGGEVEKVSLQEPPQRGEKRLFVKKEAKLPYILIAYKTPTITHDDGPALEVLDAVLSAGKSSRLYHSLVYEKQIALSASSNYADFYIDPFVFFIDATAAPGKKIEDIEKALYEEIEKIKTTPPTEREIEKAKNQIEADLLMAQDSIYFQARLIGSFEIIGDWKLKDEYLKRLEAVTHDDVTKAAQKYLISDQRTVGILLPQKPSESPETEEQKL